MNKLISISIFLLVFTYNASAQNDSIPQSIEQQNEAINLATNWGDLMTEGTAIDSLVSISGLPFALDRSEILNSNEELKSFYVKVANNISEGAPLKSIAKIYDSKYEIIEDVIPINVLIVQLTMLEGNLKDDAVYITVNISGNDMKIIGFSD